MTRKQRAESKTRTHDAEPASKKAKPENGSNGLTNAAAFEEFCEAIMDRRSIDQMRKILEANSQDSSGSDDDAALLKCLDLLFFGPLQKCPVCNSTLEFTGRNYSCNGDYSEWSTCTFRTRDPPRKKEPLKLPDSIQNTAVSDFIKSHQDPSRQRRRDLGSADKPYKGMAIFLSGCLSRTHDYWRREIEKHEGKVANSVASTFIYELYSNENLSCHRCVVHCFYLHCWTKSAGATCLIVSPAERERGGSIKIAEALERGTPVVSEAWLVDSIEKQEPQPLDDYDIATDLVVEAKAILSDKDPSEEESIMAELKLYGKRGVHKDTELQEKGGKIFEKDGILYNCAFALCNQGRGKNDYCILQLIIVPENRLHLYYKKGRIGYSRRAEERLEEWDNVDDVVKEFVGLFEEITGYEFEPWEREKKFRKKALKFYPIDMDDGVDLRCGGLSIRKIGAAAAHCKLEPLVTKLMKVLCSQDIYKYAMMEMGLDSLDLPMGMHSNAHLKRCEEVLLQYVEKLKSTKETGQKAEAIWAGFSNRWFTLMPSTRPFIFREYQELADHAAAVLETVRDITVASHLIGDLTGPTIDDPLSDRYMKLGCSISALEKDTDDYKMILNYLEKTYEPVKVGDIGYRVLVDSIYAIESSACPSSDEMKKLPNKFLLWCGTQTSNLIRHLHKGFLPAICSLPVPSYMYGKAIVCSDAAAEAAMYGFTAADRPEGFLVLAVASLGEQIIEIKSPPEDPKWLEEKQLGVKGLGRKKPDESEHIIWEDNIKVPCGRLIPSGIKDGPLKYNEYAVYDPKQVSIRFLVGVRFEEKGVVMDTTEE